MTSIKDKILAANDNRLEPVEVPEWGVTVFVPLVTLEDMEGFQKSDGPNAVARMAAFVIRDADGSRPFTDDDAPALAKKSVAAVNRIVSAFNKLNGFGDDPAKNSETTPASASS
jgi:hypothetical protein